MRFVDELKQAYENEKKRIEEQAIAQQNRELETFSAEVYEVIRSDSMHKAKTGRTHTEGFVAVDHHGLRSDPQHYENLPTVARLDSDGLFTWNDGGECSALTTTEKYCDEIIEAVSELLRKDGFVNFTLSRCPCYQKKKVYRKHFLSPDTTELIDTNNFLGYIINYSLSW